MIVGVLLAGGKSERMGRDKAGVVFDGATLAERALATLRQVSDRVVVLGHGRGCPADIPRISDEGQGPARALAKLPAGDDVYVVLPVDMPLIRPEHLRVLLDARGDRRAAHFADEPLPLVFAAGPLSDDVRLVELVEKLRCAVVAPPDASIFANVNTAKDLGMLKT